MTRSTALNVLISVILLCCAVSVKSGHQEEILKNIEEVYIGEGTGFLTIYGDTTSIFGGAYRDWNPDVYHGIVAANTLGNGRIVGCSNTAFLEPHPDATPEQPGHLGTNQFILNTARWASQLETPNVLIVRYGGDLSLERYLNTSGGMSAISINPAQLVSIHDLNGFDVALVTDPLDGDTHAAILLEFVEQNGKGLVMALRGYNSHKYIDAPGHFGQVFPPNQISSKAGFVWRNGRVGKTFAGPTIPNGNFNVSSKFTKNINTGQVWSDVYKYLNGEEGSEDFKQNPSQFISIIEMDLQSIPPHDLFLEDII